MEAAPARARVWDLPIRIFHWSIVLLIPFQWWTAENDRMELHLVGGQIMLGLILFRLLWGLVGSETARFSHFLKGPGAILAYLKGKNGRRIGHNPLGGWSAAAMLLLLAVQLGLGLFALDEEAIYGGPLSGLITYDLAVEIAELHDDLFKILLGFIGLHLAAITFYLVVRRDNLVRPMVTGESDADPGEVGITPTPAWRFVLCVSIAAAATWLIFAIG